MKPPKNQMESPDHKLERLLHPSHPLCREDVLWILEFVNKKVAERDSKLLSLSQPRLLNNFHCFAEVAMSFISRSQGLINLESGELKRELREATYGLTDTGHSH